MEKLGKQTIKFNTPPSILDCASIVGPKEAQGPLAKYFDQTLDDEFWGEKTWEKAESKIIKETVNMVIRKSRYFCKRYRLYVCWRLTKSMYFFKFWFT